MFRGLRCGTTTIVVVRRQRVKCFTTSLKNLNNMSARVAGFSRQSGSIGRERYELSKRLQEARADVALHSKTYLEPHASFRLPS